MDPHEVAFRNTATQQHKLPLSAFTEHADGQLQIAQKIASLGNKFANAMQEVGQATYSIKESINADKYGYEYEAIPGEGYQEFLKRKESLASSQFFSQQQQFINDQTNALRNSVLNGEIKTSKQFDDSLVGLEKAALENAQKIIENSEPITKERLAKKLEAASKAMFAESGIKARQEYFQIAKDIRQKQYITNAQDCALIGDVEGVKQQMATAIQDGGNIAEIGPLARALSCQATVKQYEIDIENRTINSVAFRTQLLELHQKEMSNCLKNAFSKGIYEADVEIINKGFDKIDEEKTVKDNAKSNNAIAKFQKEAKRYIPLGNFAMLEHVFFDALADGADSDDALELYNKATAEMIVGVVGKIEYYKAFGVNSEIDKTYLKTIKENIGSENYEAELKAKIKKLPIDIQKDVETKIGGIKEKIKAEFLQSNAFDSAAFAKSYEGKNILRFYDNKITTPQEAQLVWKGVLNREASEKLKELCEQYKKSGGELKMNFTGNFEKDINSFKQETEKNEYYHELAVGFEQVYYANSLNIDNEIEKHKEDMLKQEKEVFESLCSTALTKNNPAKFIIQNIDRETTYNITGVEPSPTNSADSLATLINVIHTIDSNASGEKLGGAIVKLLKNCTEKDFEIGLAFLSGDKMEGTLPAQEKKEMADELLSELGYSDYKKFANRIAIMPTEETRKISKYLQIIGDQPAELARRMHAEFYAEIKRKETKEGKHNLIAERLIELTQRIDSIESETLKAREENQRQAKQSKAVVDKNINELKQEIEEKQ